MAAPVDVDRRATVVSTAASTWTLLMPIVAVGDLLIAVLRTGGAQTITSITSPQGTWTQLAVNNADATDDNTYVFCIRCISTDAGPGTVNLSGSIKGAATVTRITGAADPATRLPEVSTFQVFTTTANTGNPPSISPTGGSKDYLFIACLGLGGATVTGATAPAGYSTGAGFAFGVSTGGNVATNAGVCTCTKQATAASEDPGVFTHPAANVGGCAFTIAVHPAGPTTHFGSVVGVTTFGRSVAGSKKTFSSLTRPFTFQASVAGNVVIPAQTYYGSLSLPIAFGAAVDGKRKTFGQLALPLIFSKEVRAQRKTFGQLTSPFLFSKDVRGQRKTFGQIAFPINLAIAISGTRVGLTQYGVVSLPVIFGKDVRGQRKAFGQLTLPISFIKDIKAQRTTFSQIIFPITFTKEAVGRKNVFGQLSMQTLFGKETAGQRKTFSQLALSMIFSKAVAGRKQTFGHVALPIGFQAFINGQILVGPKTYYGQFALPITFSKQVSARRRTFGQISAPFIFGESFQGRRRAFGKLELPIVIGFSIDIEKIITPGVILNQAEMIYLGVDPVKAVYVGDELVWSLGFDPTTFAGLVVWLDGIEYTSGMWPNKSGNPINIIGSPAMTIGPTKNGLPVVRFKANEGRVRSGWSLPVYDWTVIYVCRFWGTNVGRAFSVQYPPSNLLIGMHTVGPDLMYDNGTWINQVASWSPGPMPWRLYGADSKLSIGTRFFVDGIFKGGANGIGGMTNGWGLSGYDANGTPETMDLDVAELLIWDRRLEDVERIEVEAYLRDKWGI